MRKRMFFGAIPFIFERAKHLRINQTPAEERLWEYLKTKPLGIKFRRQHPFGPFIVDFYAHSVDFVIEVDGEVHADPEVAGEDKLRQEWIESNFVQVVRFRNEEIFTQFELVKGRIESLIQQLLSNQEKPDHAI